MPTRRLEVEIIGDDRSLQRAYGRTIKSTPLLERHFGQVGAAANRMGSRIQSGAERAVKYGTGALVLGLGYAVAEAEKAEKAGNQTRAVITSMGNAAHVSANHVQELADAIGEKTGQDHLAVQSGENLLLTFKNIRNEAGKGNDIFDRTTKVAVDMSVALGRDLKQSAIQVGKALNDPTVGLTALRRVGVSFNQQQSDQIKTLFASGKQLEAQKLILSELTKEFQGSAAAQGTSFEKLRETGRVYAEDIGNTILPELSKLSDSINEVLSDKTLTSDQKFNKVVDLLSNEVSRGIDELSNKAPQLAHAGGEIGLKLAGAVAKSFLHADVLGKLFIGGALIRVLGGPGAFSSIGGYIGKRIGRRIMTTVGEEMAAGEVAGGTAGKIFAGASAIGGKWGKLFGIAAIAGADAYVITHFSDIGNAIDPQNAFAPSGDTPTTAFLEKLKAAGFKTADVGIGGRITATTPSGRAVQVQMPKVPQGADQTVIFASKAQHAFDKATGAVQGFAGQTVKSADKASASMGKIGNSAQHLQPIVVGNFKTMQRQVNDLDVSTPIARFGKLVDGIQSAMHNGQLSVRQGTQLINQVLARELAALGGTINISPQQSAKYHKQQKQGKIPNLIPTGNQMGGVIVPGYGFGDTVPLHIAGQLAGWVEPGEEVSVLNRTATAAKMELNRQVPRRKEGGKIPTWTGSGAIGSMAAAALDRESAFASKVLAEAMQKAGGSGGSGPPGGPSGTSTWKGVLMATWVKQALEYAASKGVAPQPTSGYRSHADNVAHGRYYHSEHEYTHYPHGAVDFGGMVDPAALPKKMAVVNATRSFRFPLLAPIGFRDDGHASGTGHAQGGTVPRPRHGAHWIHGGSNWSVDEAATLLWQAGLPEADAERLARVVPAESGGNPRAHNPSGATGLFQILGQVVPGNLWDPRVNALNAVKKYRDAGNSLAPWEGLPSGPMPHILRDAVGGSSGGGGKAGGGGSASSEAFPGIPTHLIAQDAEQLYGHAAGAVNAAMSDAQKALQAAKGTPGVADDIAAIQQLAQAKGNKRTIAKALAAYRKAKKSGNKKAIRKAGEALIAVEQGVIPSPDDTGGGDTGSDVSAADLKQSIDDLTAQLKLQNQRADQGAGLQASEAARALADWLSGELGWKSDQRTMTAGAGSPYRF